MASFVSASSAVESGIDILRSLQQRNEKADQEFHLRIGISVGEPVTKAGDLFGAAVQLSARLCAIASPDGIAVSNAVRDLCVGKRLAFDHKGSHELKGFPEPVPVYEVLFTSA